jgi:2-polyprenyl-6-methoxyphenol hydroxylase-like FAD-dependent oxidoreductase
MSPVLAMGANTAIRDAAELTDQLTLAASGACSPTEALDRYRKRMEGYAGAIVAASRHTGQARVGRR